MLIEDPSPARRRASIKHRLIVVVEREVVDVRLILIVSQTRDGVWACDPVRVLAVAGFVVVVVAQPERCFGGVFDVAGREFLGFLCLFVLADETVELDGWVTYWYLSSGWSCIPSPLVGSRGLSRGVW